MYDRPFPPALTRSPSLSPPSLRECGIYDPRGDRNWKRGVRWTAMPTWRVEARLTGNTPTASFSYQCQCHNIHSEWIRGETKPCVVDAIVTEKSNFNFSTALTFGASALSRCPWTGLLRTRTAKCRHTWPNFLTSKEVIEQTKIPHRLGFFK